MRAKATFRVLVVIVADSVTPRCEGRGILWTISLELLLMGYFRRLFLNNQSGPYIYMMSFNGFETRTLFGFHDECPCSRLLDGKQ